MLPAENLFLISFFTSSDKINPIKYSTAASHDVFSFTTSSVELA